VALLQRCGQVVVLVRPDAQRPPEDRMVALLDWFGLPAVDRRRIRVVAGDIRREGLGINPAIIDDLLRTTDEVIHCASDTSFAERNRAAVEATNVDGLRHVLDFTAAGRACCFHYVSTAYVAGRATGDCPEEPVTGRTFHNVYEETKCRGEQVTQAACREAGLGLTIYRPSIVYGHSRTGRSLHFKAVYYPVRTTLFMRDLYNKDIRERGGRRAAEMGVRIASDGTTHLPLRIAVAAQGGINLIPVDYFTYAFLALWEGARDGGIFHVVNPNLTRITEVIDYSCRLFRMTGIRACLPHEIDQNPRNPLEIVYDHYLEAYGPYMRDTRVFRTDRSAPVLQARGLACPDFDYNMFKRCMTFAVEAHWTSPLSSR
jgi:nucleoside-diphosphate-sugar epimerase